MAGDCGADDGGGVLVGFADTKWTSDVNYTTVLIERSECDKDGQQLADMLAAELTYLSNNGLDGFMLVPLLNAGETSGVIIAARGQRPGAQEEEAAFRELTGLQHPRELSDK